MISNIQRWDTLDNLMMLPGVPQQSGPPPPLSLPWMSTTTRAGAWETPPEVSLGSHHKEDGIMEEEQLLPPTPQHHPQHQEDRQLNHLTGPQLQNKLATRNGLLHRIFQCISKIPFRVPYLRKLSSPTPGIDLRSVKSH